MEQKYFKNYKELADFMFKKAQDGLYIVAVLFCDDAMNTIRELLSNKEIIAEAIEIKSEEYNGYDAEYYVSITDDLVVSAEPAYYKGRYLATDSDIALLEGSVSAVIPKYITSDTCIEISIGNYENFEYEDDNCDEYTLDLDCDDEVYDVEYLKAPNGNKVRVTMGIDAFFDSFFT